MSTEKNNVNANIETDADGSTIEVYAVVDGMKYVFQIDLTNPMPINGDTFEVDEVDGKIRHEMTIHQNRCMFLETEITANPEEVE